MISASSVSERGKFYDLLFKNGKYRKPTPERADRWNLAFQNVIPFLKDNCEVLDVGCGPADLLFLISEFNKTAVCTGLDISKKQVKENIKRYPDMKFIISDIQEMCIRDKKFDIIFCIDILEHLEYPEKALKNLYDNLKPQGRLVIISPTLNVTFFRAHIVSLFRFLSKKDVEEGEHLHIFSVEYLKHMTKQAGFRPLEVICFEFPITALLNRRITYKYISSFIRALEKISMKVSGKLKFLRFFSASCMIISKKS